MAGGHTSHAAAPRASRSDCAAGVGCYARPVSEPPAADPPAEPEPAAPEQLAADPDPGPEPGAGFGPHLRRGLLLLLTVAVLVAWMDSLRGHGAIDVGRPLGEVRAELADGSAFRLADQRGKVVVLSFWATWCLPCRREVPVLSRVQREGSTVIALSIDDLPLGEIARKARALGIGYAVGKGPPALLRRLGISVVPTTCVVGKDGAVASSRTGEVDYDELHAAIAAAERR
jgi:thiol-disulfide isomerase/thioredoxin